MRAFSGRWRKTKLSMLQIKAFFNDYIDSIQGATGLFAYKYNPKESKEVSKYQSSPKIRANLPNKIRKD